MRMRRLPVALATLLILLPALMAVGSASERPLATPGSSPVAPATMPNGALGAQMLWLVDAINFPDIEGTRARMTLHVAPSFLDFVPLDLLARDFATVRKDLGMVTITEVAVVSRDYPPSIARFTLAGTTGGAVLVSLSIDPVSRQIDGLYFSFSSVDFATPMAHQALGAVLPAGSLGSAMAWLLDVLNDPGEILTDAQLSAHFTASFLNTTPPDVIRARIAAVHQAAPVTIADRLISVTMDQPPTTAGCVLIGRGGESFRLVVTIAPGGLITALVLTPVPPHAIATPGQATPGAAD